MWTCCERNQELYSCINAHSAKDPFTVPCTNTVQPHPQLDSTPSMHNHRDEFESSLQPLMKSQEWKVNSCSTSSSNCNQGWIQNQLKDYFCARNQGRRTVDEIDGWKQKTYRNGFFDAMITCSWFLFSSILSFLIFSSSSVFCLHCSWMMKSERWVFSFEILLWSFCYSVRKLWIRVVWNSLLRGFVAGFCYGN